MLGAWGVVSRQGLERWTHRKICRHTYEKRYLGTGPRLTMMAANPFGVLPRPASVGALVSRPCRSGLRVAIHLFFEVAPRGVHAGSIARSAGGPRRAPRVKLRHYPLPSPLTADESARVSGAAQVRTSKRKSRDGPLACRPKQAPTTMNDEGLADAAAANPVRLPQPSATYQSACGRCWPGSAAAPRPSSRGDVNTLAVTLPPVRSAVESTSGSITTSCAGPPPATTRTFAVSTPLSRASVWASGERMPSRRQSCVERSQATGAAPEGAVATRLFTVTSRTSSRTRAGRGSEASTVRAVRSTRSRVTWRQYRP